MPRVRKTSEAAQRAAEIEFSDEEEFEDPPSEEESGSEFQPSGADEEESEGGFSDDVAPAELPPRVNVGRRRRSEEEVDVEEKMVDSTARGEELWDEMQKETHHEEEDEPEDDPVEGRPKRGGLDDIVSGLSKKQKKSTLDESRDKWNSYSEEAGIQDKLKQHRQDGFLEKEDFLARSDERQFELEKEARDRARAEEARLANQQERR